MRLEGYFYRACETSIGSEAVTAIIGGGGRGGGGGAGDQGNAAEAPQTHPAGWWLGRRLLQSNTE